MVSFCVPRSLKVATGGGCVQYISTSGTIHICTQGSGHTGVLSNIPSFPELSASDIPEYLWLVEFFNSEINIHKCLLRASYLPEVPNTSCAIALEETLPNRHSKGSNKPP